MSDVVDEQVSLVGLMSRQIDNLKKLGKDKINRETIQTRIEILERHWEKFERNHSTLWPLRDQDEVAQYMSKDVYEQGQEAYINVKAALRTRLNEYPPQGTAAAAAPVETVTHRRKLPAISCPTFGGHFSEWRPFRDLFRSLIADDTTLTGVEKLHYLKTSLRGEPEQLLRNIPVTEDNFARAWGTLEERYENTRLLVSSHISAILELPPLRAESGEQLKALLGRVLEALGALRVLGRPVDYWDDWLVHSIAQRLDLASRREWELQLGSRKTPASFDELKVFLEGRIGALEAIAALRQAKGSEPAKGKGRSQPQGVHSHAAGTAATSCPSCKEAHPLFRCDKFRAKGLAQRLEMVKSQRLCFNCLGHHQVGECKSSHSCKTCGERHHSLLHVATPQRASSAPVSDETAGQDVGPSTNAFTVTREPQPSTGKRSVLLATAQVTVHSPAGGQETVRALLDQGSEVSFVTESLAQRLQLRRTAASLSVHGIGASRSGTTRGAVTLQFAARRQSHPLHLVEALVLGKLTSALPACEVTHADWPHLRGLELADPQYHVSTPVDILLGVEAFTTLLREGYRAGPPGTPLAQETALGWILSGPVYGPTGPGENRQLVSLQCSVEEDLAATQRRFWEQEEVTVAPDPLSPEEAACEDHFSTTHRRRADGRFVVRLPLKAPVPDLGDSTGIAGRALAALERRLRRNPAMGQAYTSFMREYETLGHMVVDDPPSTDGDAPGYYLPHHGVLGTKGKLRVVFNASARTTRGTSLNDVLHAGPKLQTELADVVLRWRRHRVAFSADIEKMFRQITMDQDDQRYQRVLWRDDPEGPIRRYRLTTVTYGLVCSPYLAIRTLRQLAKDDGPRFPLAADALLAETYVDDVLSGADDVKTAQELCCQLQGLLTAGGFTLKKWTANEQALLASLPEGALEPTASVRLEEAPAFRTLGLLWEAAGDHFKFEAQHVDSEPATKRSVLSATARLFDPLGWLAPVTVTAKIFLQELWVLGLSWDDPLPVANRERWLSYQRALPFIGAARIPRWLGLTRQVQSVELHAFADASERAMGAVVYIRTSLGQDHAEATIITAKTKVAPLKPVTLARLELTAALLAARLVRRVQDVLQLGNCQVYLWSDSTVTLAWLRRPARHWKTYVANRVAEIHTLLPAAWCRHVPGAQNPADCASRGIAPGELPHHPLWWRGPPWLTQPPSTWPAETPGASGEAEAEGRVTSNVAAAPREAPWELLHRFSDLQRLLRVTAAVRRACDAFLRRIGRPSPSAHEDQPLQSIASPSELVRATQYWIRQEQGRFFADEISCLTTGKMLSRSSSLQPLRPFLDGDNILRVGGRLKHSLLAYDEKHPMIMPRESPLVTLLIRRAHMATMHGGTQATLGYLRRKYWICGGRRTVRCLIHRCVPCFRQRAQPQPPMMASLPAARVSAPARAFLHTGVDYAGPISLVATKGRGRKSYKGFIALFVCLATRAVHLEAVSDYSSEAFLAAYQRFCARRGICATLLSDRGTTFVGADSALRALLDGASAEFRALARQLAADGTLWKFNPPAAPHFGGIWESAVRSVKHHLRRVVGDHALTFEELSTLLARVEACLNSRPLHPITDDPEDLAALTPGHFLIGSAVTAVPEPSLTDLAENRLSRWQRLRRMQVDFWRRWSDEYLHTLQQRRKWRTDAPPLLTGELVLMKDERLPPTKWALARVIALHPGEDGRVRVATVRTANGQLVRPLVKLCALPSKD